MPGSWVVKYVLDMQPLAQTPTMKASLVPAGCATRTSTGANAKPQPLMSTRLPQAAALPGVALTHAAVVTTALLPRPLPPLAAKTESPPAGALRETAAAAKTRAVMIAAMRSAWSDTPTMWRTPEAIAEPIRIA